VDDQTIIAHERGLTEMRKIMRNRLGIALVVAIVSAFAVAPVAVAQDDPSAAQYNPPIPDPGGTAGTTASGSEGESGLNSNIGSLPFTGMDLLIVAGVAFVLTGTGFALRRLSTPRGPSAF
jgi:hypothetical protein